MKVGIILLSQDNYYLDNYGELPKRPEFDKELLVALCKLQTFTCGQNTFKSLPDSILRNAFYTEGGEYDVNLGIITLVENPPHLLLVSRSDQYIHDGKHFSLKDYTRYFDSPDLELWIKNT